MQPDALEIITDIFLATGKPVPAEISYQILMLEAWALYHERVSEQQPETFVEELAQWQSQRLESYPLPSP